MQYILEFFFLNSDKLLKSFKIQFSKIINLLFKKILKFKDDNYKNIFKKYLITCNQRRDFN